MIGVAILCGGSGSRLKKYLQTDIPKQFDKRLLNQNTSLFQKTILRARRCFPESYLIIVTSVKYQYIACSQVDELLIDRYCIILEPQSKNTLPALCLAIGKALTEDLNQIISIPSDHLITEESNYETMLKKLVEQINDSNIYVIGHKLHGSLNSNFGYIIAKKQNMGDYNCDNVLSVCEFVEKPSGKKIADLNLIDKSQIFLNGGIIISYTKTLVEAISKHCDQVATALCNKKVFGKELVSCNNVIGIDSQIFNNVVPISFDHGLLQKAENLMCITTTTKIADVGNIVDLFSHPTLSNTNDQSITRIDCEGNFVYNTKEDHQIVLCGTNDLVVINKRHSTIIAAKDYVNNNIFLGQVAENVEIEYRKWGYFEVLNYSQCYKVKKLFINPRQSTSLQFHNYRTEHHVVLSGVLTITVDEEIKVLYETQSITVPLKMVHKLTNNCDKEMLVILETQYGSKVDEDDIIRIDID